MADAFHKQLKRFLLSDADQSGKTTVHGDKYDRLAFSSQRIHARQQTRCVDPLLPQESGVSQENRPALHFSAHAFARYGLEVAGLGKPQSLGFGGLNDGRRQRMFATALQAGSQAEQLVVGQAWRGSEETD